MTEEITAPDTATTAFIVIVLPDGNVRATADLSIELAVERVANLGDMRRSCGELIHEINIQQTASQASQGVMDAITQAAQQAGQPQVNSAVAKNLQKRGFSLPNGA